MDQSPKLQSIAKPLVSNFIKVAVFVSSVLLLTALVIYSANTIDPAKDTGRLIEKLNELDSVLYVDAGTESYQQLSEFNPYTMQLAVVNCAENETSCQAKQIEEVPTIVINKLGLDLTGLQTKDQLIDLLKQIGIW